PRPRERNGFFNMRRARLRLSLMGSPSIGKHGQERAGGTIRARWAYCTRRAGCANFSNFKADAQRFNFGACAERLRQGGVLPRSALKVRVKLRRTAAEMRLPTKFAPGSEQSKLGPALQTLRWGMRPVVSRCLSPSRRCGAYRQTHGFLEKGQQKNSPAAAHVCSGSQRPALPLTLPGPTARIPRDAA